MFQFPGKILNSFTISAFLIAVCAGGDSGVRRGCLHLPGHGQQAPPHWRPGRGRPRPHHRRPRPLQTGPRHWGQQVLLTPHSFLELLRLNDYFAEKIMRVLTSSRNPHQSQQMKKCWQRCPDITELLAVICYLWVIRVNRACCYLETFPCDCIQTKYHIISRQYCCW